MTVAGRRNDKALHTHRRVLLFPPRLRSDILVMRLLIAFSW
jgi:hypothetical protein